MISLAVLLCEIKEKLLVSVFTTHIAETEKTGKEDDDLMAGKT